MRILKRIFICLALLMGGMMVNETTTPVCYAQIPLTYHTFTGKIGGKYGITMAIYLPDNPKVSCNIHGSYYYGNGKNGSLTLSGRYMSGDIWLDEYNAKGQYCGSWSISVCRSGNGKIMTGSMTNSKGKRYSVSCKSRY